MFLFIVVFDVFIVTQNSSKRFWAWRRWGVDSSKVQI